MKQGWEGEQKLPNPPKHVSHTRSHEAMKALVGTVTRWNGTNKYILNRYKKSVPHTVHSICATSVKLIVNQFLPIFRSFEPKWPFITHVLTTI